MNSYQCTILLCYEKFRRKTVIYAIPWKRSYLNKYRKMRSATSDKVIGCGLRKNSNAEVEL